VLLNKEADRTVSHSSHECVPKWDF